MRKNITNEKMLAIENVPEFRCKCVNIMPGLNWNVILKKKLLFCSLGLVQVSCNIGHHYRNFHHSTHFVPLFMRFLRKLVCASSIQTLRTLVRCQFSIES